MGPYQFLPRDAAQAQRTVLPWKVVRLSTLKTISQLISIGLSLFADPNIMDLPTTEETPPEF